MLSSHLSKVSLEITKTKELEAQLIGQSEKARVQWALLKSRKDALQLRENLQGNLSSATSINGDIDFGLGKVEEEILRMEAQIESLDRPTSQFRTDIREIRRQRSNYKHQGRLESLKKSLHSRQLPQVVCVDELQPEIVVGGLS